MRAAVLPWELGELGRVHGSLGSMPLVGLQWNSSHFPVSAGLSHRAAPGRRQCGVLESVHTLESLPPGTSWASLVKC